MLNNQHFYGTTIITVNIIKGLGMDSKVFTSSNNLGLLDSFSLQKSMKCHHSAGLRGVAKHQVGSQQVTCGILRLQKFIKEIIIKA